MAGVLASIIASAWLIAAPQPPAAAGPFDAAAYERSLADIEARRVQLGARFAKATTAAERVAIRNEARKAVLSAITDVAFPGWMGTPWGLGRDSAPDRPHQPGKVVGCSYFVTGVLENAGLRLASRARFAQAPSLLMQRALTPDPAAMHRYPGLPPAALHDRLSKLGDGLYIVGLNIHTAFLLITRGEVHVIHASYMPPNQVVDEPLTRSEVIELSRRRGYVVTPLFEDDRLVDLWLSGRPVPSPTWKPPPRDPDDSSDAAFEIVGRPR